MSRGSKTAQCLSARQHYASSAAAELRAFTTVPGPIGECRTSAVKSVVKSVIVAGTLHFTATTPSQAAQHSGRVGIRADTLQQCSVLRHGGVSCVLLLLCCCRRLCEAGQRAQLPWSAACQRPPHQAGHLNLHTFTQRLWGVCFP